MTIAVTGATGFVGQALLDMAAAQDIAVRALARREQPPRAGVTWYAGDLASSKALSRLVQGTEAVIHIAGVTSAPTAAEFEAGNVTGTLAAVEAALAMGVPRFVHVSSLSAREPGLSLYGASKARAERVVKASGLDWTIVRPPAVYGPRDRDMFELFRAASWGVVPAPKGGWTSMIHAEDLARLLLALIRGGEDVTHRVFEPDDGKPGGWSYGELGRAIGDAVGKRARVLPLSRKTMEFAARVDRRMRGSKARLTLDRVGYMTHPDWIASHGAKVHEGLWKPRIDTRAGLKATADWYRGQGWL